MIRILKRNESHLKIEGPPDFLNALSKKLTVTIPNFQHTPAFKNAKGKWDGSVRYFSQANCNLLYGHLNEVLSIAQELNYKVTLETGVNDVDKFSVADVNKLLDEANLPAKFERRDYQLQYASAALSQKRILIESPTGSGKSFLMYIILLKLLDAMEGRIAVIVPRTSLVEQMYSDFADYGMDVERYCGRIYAKYKDINPDKRIYITTWQSIATRELDYFLQFEAVLGDEAHTFKAKSLRYIMENCNNASYRIGLTGTIPSKPSEKLLVEGLFGPEYNLETSRSLIDRGVLNEMHPIKVKVLKYSETERKLNRKTKYQEEIDFIINSDKRNKYLKELTKSLSSNTLLLFSRVEAHGKPLYELIKDRVGKNVYFISGEVETIEREKIRKIMESESDAVIIASMGTFSTGINIPNLNNLILAMPTKSDELVVQMIGRVLRKSDSPTKVYDIVDDLSWNGEHNYAMRHALERIKIYAKKEYDYVIETEQL